MAIKHRQRQISTAWMVDGGEAAMRDNIERLLAAVIGVGAPADIGQEARGVAKPAFFGDLIEPGRRYEPISPFDQLFAVAGRTRPQAVELARRFDQGVLFLVFLLEQRIEQTLAHAERGKYHPVRL